MAPLAVLLAAMAGTITPPVLRDSLGAILLRFLRFGLLAWGGPVAQIAMLKAELVDREKWIDPARFNRVLAVYQVLPGPEATELCIYFGMLRGGRLGGLLAGLGFILPGVALMLLLAWAYQQWGITPIAAAAMAGAQPAVCALIVRAVARIGQHALLDRWLWGIALLSLAASLAGVHFVFVLIGAGAVYATAARGWFVWAGAIALAGVLALSLFWLAEGLRPGADEDAAAKAAAAKVMPLDAIGKAPHAGAAPVDAVFYSGLRAGMLSFGGAYTALPFLRHDAVVAGEWLTERQFVDGIALGGVAPAPLVVVGTFVGFAGAGWLGAGVMTFAIFLPAFAITLLGHAHLEKLVSHKPTHATLDGITAGVVGLIGATAIQLMGIVSPTTFPEPLHCPVFAMTVLVPIKLAVPFTVAPDDCWRTIVCVPTCVEVVV